MTGNGREWRSALPSALDCAVHTKWWIIKTSNQVDQQSIFNFRHNCGICFTFNENTDHSIR